MNKEKLSRKRMITLISDEEKIALCKNWKASKLSLVKFCNLHAISKSSLYGWYKKFFSFNEVKDPPAFTPLTPRVSTTDESEKISIELKLSNGAVLHLKVSERLALNLIQEISDATKAIR